MTHRMRKTSPRRSPELSWHRNRNEEVNRHRDKDVDVNTDEEGKSGEQWNYENWNMRNEEEKARDKNRDNDVNKSGVKGMNENVNMITDVKKKNVEELPVLGGDVKELPERRVKATTKEEII